MERIAGIRVDVDADISGLKRALADANNRLNSLEGGFKGSGTAAKGMGGAIENAGKSLAGLATIGAAFSIGSKIIATTSEFQKLNAVLANTLGGANQGAVAFAKIQDFAAKTNFSVLELTNGFVRLANGGFVPTTRELTKLADLANSTGKDFNQLAEAILDAQTGEFERLKEFGIKAKQSGDQVELTFKGVSTTIDKSSESLRNYIVGLGDLEGVSGSTAAISETLGGKISNLGDAFDNLFNSAGNSSGGFATKIIDAFTRITNATAKAIDGQTQYLIKQNLIQQGKISEELPAQIKSLQKDYENIGYSAAEAAKKAKAFFTEGPKNEAAQLEKQLENLDRQFAKIESRSRKTTPGLFQSGYSTDNLPGREFTNEGDRDQIDALKERQRVVNSAIAVQLQYADTIQDTEIKESAALAVTKEHTKAIDKIGESIRGTYKDFELAAVNAKILGEEQDILAKQTGILESGITKLTDLGLRPGNKALDEMIAKYRELGQSDLTKLQKTLSGVNPIENTPVPKLGAAGEIPVPTIDNATLEAAIDETLAQMGRIPKGNAEINASIAGANEQFKSLMGQAAASLAQGTADLVGALAAGEEVTGKQVVGFLGSIARQIGAGLIAIGTPLLLVPGTQAKGLAYLAGGIALTAVGAALSAGNVPGKGGGGGASAAPVTGGFSAPVTANTAASTASPTRSTQPAAGTGTTSTELTISGKLQISDEGGALVGYIDKQKVKLSRTGG